MFRLLPYQKKIFDDHHQYLMLAGGRKIGKSWFIPILMLRDSRLGARLIIYCASAFEQTNEVWVRWLEPEFQPFIKKMKANPRRIWLKNGTVITLCTAGSGFRLRGPKADALYLDEAAFIEQSIIDNVLLPCLTVAKTPRVFATSTFNGQDGWFWDRYNDQTWHQSFATYLDNPYANKEFIAKRRLEMTEDDFNQEYMGVASTSGDAAIKELDRALIDEPNPIETIISSIGIDLGRHNDETSILVLDQYNEVRHNEYLPNMAWPDQVKHIMKIINRFPEAVVAIDRSGVGDVVSETLQEQMPHRRLCPFTFTQQTRSSLYKTLIGIIQRGEVKIPKKFNKLISQLRSLRYKKVNLDFRYDHPDGGHDDGPISLALALWAQNSFVSEGRRHFTI